MKYRIQTVLKDTLRRFELEELSKPKQDQKPVPTITDIAEKTGYSRNAISNLANDNRTLVDLAMVGAIVTHLVAGGFTVGIQDIFQIVPDTEPTQPTE